MDAVIEPAVVTILIELNGAPRPVRAGATVRALIQDELRLPVDRIAIELNRELLPRNAWDRPLAGGDRLEVVTFVGGG